MHWTRIDSDGKAHFSVRERLKKNSLMNSPMVIIMMIKIMMFQDRICSSVFSSRASRGQFSLSSVVPFIAHRGRRIHPFLGSCSDSWFKERGI